MPRERISEEEIMHISSMTIDNYRTFRHVVFQFDRQVNYMVGDNNIGKSNFLCLLKWISHGYGFREGDFLDADHPIEIRLTLSEEAGGREGRALSGAVGTGSGATSL